MKKILIISYHFPPSLAVGAKRVGAIARHLPDLGWETYILTVDDKYIVRIDDVSKIPSVKHILKTSVFPTLRDGYLYVKSFFQKRGKDNNDGIDKQSKEGNVSRDYWNKHPFRYLIRDLKNIFTFLPDFEKGWVPPAIPAAIRAIRKEGIDWILTSSPPHSTHLVGWIAKRATGVRWVADFRDPWLTGREGELGLLYGKGYFHISKFLEGVVVHNADIVITTTDRLRDAMRTSYNSKDKKKIHCITNGYESENFPDPRTIEKFEKFTLTYTGTIYLKQTPEPIFRAVSELIQEKKVEPGKIAIKLVGNCDFALGAPVELLIRKYHLEKVVERIPPVSSRKATEILMRSHMGILLAPEIPFSIPSKVFEYLAAEVPVLALTEEGATRDLIEASRAGAAFLSDEFEGIMDFILKSMQAKENADGAEKNRLHNKEYDRKNLIKKMHRYIEEFERGK